MARFPKRYVTAVCPSYEEAQFRLLVNPPGTLYTELLTGDFSTDEMKQALGAAMCEVYDGAKVDAYGMTFDFSTAAAAVATIQNEELPAELRFWLRNAPVEVVQMQIEDIQKNWRGSFEAGKA